MQENNVINQMNQPISNPVPTNDQRPKVNSFLVILLSILLFISVSIAGFFAFQTQKLVKEFTNLKNQSTATPVASIEPTIEPISTNSTTTDPTANWEIYISTKTGYSVKYPKSIPIESLSGNFNCTTCIEELRLTFLT